MITPGHVSVAKLNDVDNYFPAASSHEVGAVEEVAWHKHVFDMDYASNRSIDFLKNVCVHSSISVLEGLVQADGPRYYCDGDPVPLLTFLANLPAPRQPIKKDKRKGDEKVIKELPWVERGLKQRKAIKKKTAPIEESSSSLSSEEDDEVRKAQDDDTLAFKRWKQLEDLRGQWEVNTDLRCGDFQVKVLGTEWTWQEKGLVADAISGQCASEDIQKWCVARNVFRGFRVEINLYTAATAASLCRGWVSKMQHFYNRSLRRPEGEPFTEDDRTSWKPPADYLAAVDALRGHAMGQKRIRQISNLFT